MEVFNDSPQTVIVYGGTENVPKKKNSWVVVKLFLILKIFF